MFTILFWKAALERVVFTAAETLLALLTTNGFGVTDLTTAETWSVVGLAALAAVLKTILSALGNGSPSAINAELIPDGTGKYRATNGG